MERSKKSKSVKRAHKKPEQTSTKKDKNWISLLVKDYKKYKLNLLPVEVLNQIWDYYAMLKWNERLYDAIKWEEEDTFLIEYKWIRIYNSGICVEHTEERFYKQFPRTDDKLWLLDNNGSVRIKEDRRQELENDMPFDRLFLEKKEYVQSERLVLSNQVRSVHDDQYANGPYHNDETSYYDDADGDQQMNFISELCNTEMESSPYEIYMHACKVYNSKLQQLYYTELKVKKLEKELIRSKYTGKYKYKELVKYQGDMFYIKDYNFKTNSYVLNHHIHGRRNNIPEDLLS